MNSRLKPLTGLLIEFIEKAYDKKSWHGTNLRGSIRGLTIKQLTWRPGKNRHNAWEIALHAAYWKYATYRRLTGSEKGSFPRTPSDWPAMPKKPDLRSWKADLALLQKYHKLLIEAVRDFPQAKLDKRMPKSDLLYKQIIYGIASHDLYHAGQIQLLKRLMKSK